MIIEGTDQIGKTLTASVCIVGSGPAGCTAANFLVQQGIDVILLDGSRKKWPNPNEPVTNAYLYNENDLLYNGETAGLMAENEPEFLIRPSISVGHSFPTERELIYGGTGTHWGGQSRPLDPVVFEKRPGFPGWPVTRAELDPYYDLASDFCCLYGDYYGPNKDVPGYNFTGEFWSKVVGEDLPRELDGFDFTMYQFFNDRQFQVKRVGGRTIGEQPKATVILNASVLTTNTTGGAVSSVTVGVLNEAGKPAGTFTVKAQIVVLACGAVANARQLLLSGLGGDVVGRYFMAHPIANGANAVSVSGSIPSGLFAFYRSLPAEVLENSQTYAITGKWVPNRVQTIELETSRAWFNNSGSSDFYHGTLPCADSRITLADTKDIFGQQQTKITWILADRSETNYQELTGLFSRSIEKAYGYEVGVNQWPNVVPLMRINGHHLGTTRMGWTPADSVVDSNLQVHGAGGLFVAGSSVWASSGISNPTFSIVTFSIRLADYIGKQLGKAGVTRVRACPAS